MYDQSVDQEYCKSYFGELNKYLNHTTYDSIKKKISIYDIFEVPDPVGEVFHENDEL